MLHEPESRVSEAPNGRERVFYLEDFPAIGAQFLDTLRRMLGNQSDFPLG